MAKAGGLKKTLKKAGHSVSIPVGNKWPVGVHVRLRCNCSKGGLEKAFHHHCRHLHHFLRTCREPLVSLLSRHPPFLPASLDLPIDSTYKGMDLTSYIPIYQSTTGIEGKELSFSSRKLKLVSCWPLLPTYPPIQYIFMYLYTYQHTYLHSYLPTCIPTYIPTHIPIDRSIRLPPIPTQDKLPT